MLDPVVVARDGAEALDYLFARGAHAKRPRGRHAADARASRPEAPEEIDGLEVLRQLRADGAYEARAGRRLDVVGRGAGRDVRG